MKTTMIAGLVSLALVGCAATPKPELSEDGYTAVSAGNLVMETCAKQGNMSAQDAAAGQLFISEMVSGYQINPARYTEVRTALLKENKPITKEECTEAAIQVSKWKQQQEKQRHAAIVEAQQVQSIPKSRTVNTYCNRIGTQVLCNSY